MPNPFVWAHRPPIVYRYLDPPYVNEFFESGRLRLSSFTTFRKHIDEQRLDAHEGDALLHGIGPTQDVYAVVRAGVSALILSTSTQKHPDLARAFQCEGCFAIRNTFGFARAVARALPNFTHGVEGFCMYSSNRIVSTRMSYDPKDIPPLPGGGLPMEMLPQLLGDIAGSEPYFLKHESYASQCEYRFVWMVTGMEPDILFVECPGARQFCSLERV